MVWLIETNLPALNVSNVFAVLVGWLKIITYFANTSNVFETTLSFRIYGNADCNRVLLACNGKVKSRRLKVDT